MKLAILFFILAIATQTPVRAEIDGYKTLIKTTETEGKLYFEHCEVNGESSFCKPLSKMGIEENDIPEFEKFCRQLRVFGPLTNIGADIIMGGGGLFLGIVVGTPGGPAGIGAGAVIGTTAGTGLANLLAPPVDSKKVGTALRYMDGIIKQNSYVFDSEKESAIEKGLSICLKRYESYERGLQFMIQEEENSRYGNFIP
jgi:hypothetical protein